jgi:hypothetical protein
MIRRRYEAGDDLAAIAREAGVTVQEADIYLTAWCDAGCPGGFGDETGFENSIGE